MTLGVFIVYFFVTGLLLTIERIDIIQVHLLNVIILGILVNWHHDFTVDVIVCIWVREDDFKLRIVSDVEFKLSSDI